MKTMIALLAFPALVLLMAWPLTAHGKDKKDVTVAVSWTLPPFVFPETDTGIDLEIAKKALAFGDYNLTPSYMSYGRTAKDLRERNVDGALTVSEIRGIDQVHFTNKYICYQNVAVTLEESGNQIPSIEDMQDISVVAFQDATKILGDQFKQAAQSSPLYREVSNQENQVALLYMQRTEAIVLDVNIFTYYQNNSPKADIDVPVNIWRLFPASCYSAAFLDEEIKNAFNRGLKQLICSGEYESIFFKYGIKDIIPLPEETFCPQQ